MKMNVCRLWFVNADSTSNLSSLTGKEDYRCFPPELLNYFWEVTDDCTIVLFIHEQSVLGLR
jgi:hypothetical protein